MKINASSRLLAANLPPEFLSIPKNSYFRREISRSLLSYGVDLNTAKFEKISNEDALRVLKGGKGFGVLFCFDFNTYRDNRVNCTVIGVIKTSTRYSTVTIRSTYREDYRPITIIKECDVVYFVKGSQAEYDRLLKQSAERYMQNRFEALNPAEENKKRYQSQLAERRLQKATANAKELIELIKNAAANLIRDCDFSKSYGQNPIGRCLKPLESYLEKEVFNDYRVSLYYAADVAKGEVSTKEDAETINFLATLDLNKVRNDLSRF